VIFELLCGHPPFVGDNPVSVAFQHVREVPRPPSASNRDVTPEIDAVVLKALAKNPLNRYQSAGEMRADVMRAAAGRPVSAPPVMTEDEMATVMAQQNQYRPPPASRQAARANQRQKRKSSTGVVVVLTVLALLAVAALSIGLYLANQDPMVPVPTLTGRTEAEANNALKQSNLLPDPHQGPTQDCKTGTVLTQNPAAGKQVKQGSQVDFQVCGAPELVTIPPLVRFSEDEAKKALQQAGLKPVSQERDGIEPKGEVVASDPAPGQQIARGSTVTIFISKNNQATLPNVVGKTQAQAEAALSQAGFTNVTTKTVTTGKPEDVGNVTFQSKPANKNYLKTEPIQINVAVDANPTANPSGSVKPSGSATP
jgi:beta-lactam-binding protein with PASTA domain